MYKYAIVGFGGLGKTHFLNLIPLAQERGDFCLQAICGADPEALTKSVKLNIGEVDLSQIDFSDCHFYRDYKEMLDQEQLDFIISALPTYLHEQAAVYALNKGIHVFSEKPMALTAEGCENMIHAAKENSRQLMIGQCLRFAPAYAKLKEYIDNKTFGRAYRAEFTRYSQLPTWTWNNWILDPAQSGGCVLDMHVHDVDLINWFFGMPDSLRSAATGAKAGLESVFTQYFYKEKDLLVTANADWSMTQTFPFEERCLINFEEATIIVQDSKLTVYRDEDSFSPELEDKDQYVEEMRTFLKLIIDGEACSITSPESVYASVTLALKEIESAQTGRELFLKN